MQLLIINPNTTQSMTAKIADAANSVALSDTTITAVNPAAGPASIQGYYDEAACMPGILDLVKQHQGMDAIVLACFDDTGLDAVRCMTDSPVLGIGEAAYHAASVLSNRFSVVTTLARSVPALEHNLMKYGLAARCCGVRSSEVPVLDLEKPGSDARDQISKEIRLALNEDKAEAIVLGCAGMADLAKSLASEHGVPVLDGVVCAVSWAESLVRVGLKTSKSGGYTPAVI